MATFRLFRALIDCEGLIAGNGHVCGARKGKTCPIPPELEGEARKHGMVPIDEDADAPVPVLETPINQPLPDEEEREQRIYTALEAIVGRNSPEDFAATTGLPKVPAVRHESEIPDVMVDEVRAQWAKLQGALAEG